MIQIRTLALSEFKYSFRKYLALLCQAIFFVSHGDNEWRRGILLQLSKRRLTALRCTVSFRFTYLDRYFWVYNSRKDWKGFLYVRLAASATVNHKKTQFEKAEFLKKMRWKDFPIKIFTLIDLHLIFEIMNVKNQVGGT